MDGQAWANPRKFRSYIKAHPTKLVYSPEIGWVANPARGEKLDTCKNNWTPARDEEVWATEIIGRKGRPVVLMVKILDIDQATQSAPVELVHQLNLPVVFERTVPLSKITPLEE